MTILGLVVAVIVICLLWWALSSLLRAFGVGDPIATIVMVIFVVLVVLWLLATVFGLNYGLRIR